MKQYNWDQDRNKRTGVPEAVYCEGKSVEQIDCIITESIEVKRSILLTRLSQEKFNALPDVSKTQLDYCGLSKTAILNQSQTQAAKLNPAQIVIVAAGTSDAAVAKEIARVLEFNGQNSDIILDVGVAGLWRLLDRIEEIRTYPIVIGCAGMEGALFSVLAGLIDAPLIAVPTSVGYGVSANGKTALESALASCSPGIMTMNIDNGFGAAAAALKMLNAFHKLKGSC